MHKEKNQAAILGRILRELKPFLGHILLSLFCALITVILTLEIPVLDRTGGGLYSWTGTGGFSGTICCAAENGGGGGRHLLLPVDHESAE